MLCQQTCIFVHTERMLICSIRRLATEQVGLQGMSTRTFTAHCATIVTRRCARMQAACGSTCTMCWTHACRLAATRFDLHFSALFASSLASDVLQSCQVWILTWHFTTCTMVGLVDVQQSGIGRERGDYVLYHYTEVRFNWLLPACQCYQNRASYKESQNTGCCPCHVWRSLPGQGLLCEAAGLTLAVSTPLWDGRRPKV